MFVAYGFKPQRSLRTKIAKAIATTTPSYVPNSLNVINYKVIGCVEIYNFRIDNINIRGHLEKN